MYWAKKLLAYIGILRIVDLRYNDGRIRQGEIVAEDSVRYCIKALEMMGFCRRTVCNWVSKFDPTISNIHWNPWSRLALAATVCLVVAMPYLLVYSMTTGNYGYAVDSETGLPVAGHIFYPERLPDGHYTVAKVTPQGDAAIIIQHLAGPDRDFAYYMIMNVEGNALDNCATGQRFTVFQGKFI